MLGGYLYYEYDKRMHMPLKLINIQRHFWLRHIICKPAT